MDSLTLNEIAGEHLTLYERYFQEANPSNFPFLNALEAATFLRKCGLTQLILKNIWDLSDPECLGYLDKKAFFVSLKLIAMAQNGKELNISDLKTPLPQPMMSDNLIWRISAENAQNYTALFNSMKPNDGKLSGGQVKPHMMNSKLPVEILTKIWDLSDIDQDGFLNLKEFILSCFLISKATQGFLIPNVLPLELLNFDPNASRQTAVPTLTWIVSTEDKVKSDEEFLKLDKDADGFVTGIDVKDTLLQSGLPQNALAHIWNLCDIKGNGKLNAEQFALATYFIKQKQNAMELPLQLAPNMVPPTLRPKPIESTSNENLNGVLGKPASTGNKELDSLTEEIKQLQLDKVKYESDVTAEEASLRLKQSEIKNLQNEIENLSQTLKQLENQKNDATRRLNDLNAQISLLETDLHEIKVKLVESEKVENLNRQYQEQKKSIEDQEGDLVSKRKEFETLKLEEAQLETKLNFTKGEVDQVSEIATKTQLEISQAKANFVELEEYERRSNEMLDDFDNAIANFDYAKIASLLPRTITPPPFLTEESQTIDDFNVSKAEFTVDPFAGEDPFKDDPFGSKGNDSTSENFANFDAFGASFPTNKDDPFGFSPFDAQSKSCDAFRSESPTPALPPKKSKPPPPRPAPPKSSNKTPLRAAPPPPQKDIAISSNTNSTFSNSNFDPFNDNRDPFNSDSTTSQNFANFADFDKA